MSQVSIAACDVYEADAVRRAVAAVLAPVGGMERFVRPGMRVLLKPNLLLATDLSRAVTTHPLVVQAVAESVQAAGGIVLIGDSPGGDVEVGPQVYEQSGIAGVATQVGADVVPFERAEWKQLEDRGYLISKPVLEADLIINLPKLKTHTFTLYTGAIKNLFGVVPGTRKREIHCQALGIQDFSTALVDILELTRPGLTIMDGVWGQEGNGPGVGGTPRRYGCLAAAADPVALDAVLSRALGYRTGEVLHVALADRRGLGNAGVGSVQVVGDDGALAFGEVDHPAFSFFAHRMPSWLGRLVYRVARLSPELDGAECLGCGRCAEACPRSAVEEGQPPSIDLEACVGCMCCAEVCPQGAIQPHRNLLARLMGFGR